MRRYGIIISLQILLIFMMTSCQEANNAMSETPSNIETDLHKLSQFINLPYPPQSALWQVIRKGGDTIELGPNDWALVAILQYDENTIIKFRVEMANLQPLEKLVVQSNFVQDWFSQAIQNSFIKDEGTDYLTLSVPRYSASQFTKSPLLNGYFFLTENGEIFLYLFTT